MSNPYTLPEGNVQISFSGGRTSGFMLNNIIHANGGLRSDVAVTFANTGREMPETLDFVQECADKWGIEIVWVEYDPDYKFKIVTRNTASLDGAPFDQLIKKYNRLPNPRQRFCTGKLKIQSTNAYLKSIGWQRWHNAIGIRYDERHRLNKNELKYIQNWHPMSGAKHTQAHVHEFWQANNFDLRLASVNGKTIKGNCDFCFLKSEAALAGMYRQFPERGQWWSQKEQQTNMDFKQGKTFAGLFDFVDRQGDWIFDDDAFLCQANDGECTG
tara:strand:- start:720 stop:1532 length:813 start_codon:yes stop_codon:yes gene_type:complete